LGSYKNSERAFNAIKYALKQDSISDQIRFRAFQGLAEMGDPRGLELAIEYLKHGKEFQGRSSAALTVGKLGKEKPEALEALISTKDDPDVRVKSSAAFAVQKLGDVSAVSLLEEWLSTEALGKVRRNLRESIFFLKQGASEKQELAKLNEQVGKLSEENKKLNERIALLEASTAQKHE
jgi:aminopeptidase N